MTSLLTSSYQSTTNTSSTGKWVTVTETATLADGETNGDRLAADCVRLICRCPTRRSRAGANMKDGPWQRTGNQKRAAIHRVSVG